MGCNRPIPEPLPLWSPFGGDGWADTETADRHLLDHCSVYSACLSRAATEGWRGWSCVACRAFSSRENDHIVVFPVDALLLPPEPPEPPEQENDSPGEDDDSQNTGAASTVVVTSESVGGKHRVLSGVCVVRSAISAGLRWLEAVRVGVASCPVCEAHLLVGTKVLRDGYCQECKGYLVAAGEGVAIEPGRSRDDEEIRRERRYPGGVRGGKDERRGLLSIFIAAVQVELWGEE